MRTCTDLLFEAKYIVQIMTPTKKDVIVFTSSSSSIGQIATFIHHLETHNNCYLTSDETKFVSGVVIVIDGGYNTTNTTN